MKNTNPLELKSVPPSADPDNWVFTEQAAELMGLPARRFRDYASAHKLPRQKEGIRAYYRRELILAEIGRRESRKNQAQRESAAAAQSAQVADAAPLPAAPSLGVDKLAAAQQALSVLADLVTVIRRA